MLWSMEETFLINQWRNDLRTYDNIEKFTTGQKDYYAPGCLPDYLYFKQHYNMIAIDISKLQALDTNPKAILKIYFTGNLDWTWEAKETILDFSQETMRVLQIYFALKLCEVTKSNN